VALDFERGAHRALAAVPTLPPGDWSDVSKPAEWLREAREFDILVIGSLGRVLDSCQASVVASNPCFRVKGGDTPTPHGWGALRTAFTRWLRQVRQGFGGQVGIVAHAREARDADGKPAGWRMDGTGGSVPEVAQESDMIGFVERLDDEHAGVDWFPGHGGRDVIGKNPGMLPQLKCADDDSGFLQRMIDRTRERIRARHRHSEEIADGATNHRDAGSDRLKRQPQPAVAETPAPVPADESTDDIPF